MKKSVIFLSLFVLAITLSACGLKKQLMNQPAEDKNYHYENADLGFSLTLPPEFIYYQTQRKELPDYTELAIFVPTADITYQQEVSGYGKPITVEIYEEKNWDKLSGADDKEKLNLIGVKGDRVYVLVFWQRIPNDWDDKWNDVMKNKIINGFKIK